MEAALSLRHVETLKELAIAAPGAAASTIRLDFGDPTDAGGTGLDWTTAFVTGSAMSQFVSDGFLVDSESGCPISQPVTYHRSWISANSTTASLTTNLFVHAGLGSGLPLAQNDWSQ